MSTRSDAARKAARALNASLSPEERSERARRAALAGAEKRRQAKEATKAQVAASDGLMVLVPARLGSGRCGERVSDDLAPCPVCGLGAPLIRTHSGVVVLMWHYPSAPELGYVGFGNPRHPEGGYCRGTRNDWAAWITAGGVRRSWGRP